MRGELAVNVDAVIAYRIGHSLAHHFGVGNFVIGYDASDTSPELAEDVARGGC